MGLDVISLGEMLVEVMRRDLDVPHGVPGVYLGPYPSGAPAIFIDAAANLGLNSGFIGVVGDDEFGELLTNRLNRDGVDIIHVRVARGYTTGIAFVMYFSSGERRFVFHLRHSAAGQLSPDDVKEEYISKARFLHVMGSSLAINESCRESCYKAVEIAKNSGVTITFDPNLRPELLDVETIREICEPVIKASLVVLPSKDEATALTGVADPLEAGMRMLNMGPKITVIKMGRNGALAVTKDETFFEASFKVEEVDPTGAGDVYDAAFIYGLMKGWPLPRIMEFASAAGAIKVTRFGPMEGPTSAEEIEKFIAKTEKRKVKRNTTIN